MRGGGSKAPRYLGGVELSAALSVPQAVEALKRAFSAWEAGDAVPRARHAVTAGELLVMPAEGAEGIGVKLVTITPENVEAGLPLIHGIYALFRPGTMEPEALIDAAALTGLRTASVSALATTHLARPDAHRLVIFGAGAQAEAHVAAMTAIRPIGRITIVANGGPRARPLIERLREQGLHAELGDRDAVADADIVCTCTTSSQPVFDGTRLAAGAHVNAIGAYRHDLCELDGPLLRRATLVVEERQAALSEAGDLIQAIEAGHIAPESIAGELRDVATGAVRRDSAAQISVFKSVGLAIEDLVVARAVVESLSD